MKRNLKRILCASGFLVCGFVLGSCSTTVNAKTHIGSDGICDTYILTDKDTKVEYIVVTTDTYFGQSCSITPRLKSNGELYINR